MRRTIQSLFLKGPAGRLEAMWELPAESRPDLAALVCHPHPLHGGTMHNKVVHHASLALQESQIPVLRFNFRGAGLSEGPHDNGRGEAEDVRTALDWLAGERPDADVVLAGFSFGAWVGLRVGCEAPRVKALIGVGVPADLSDHSYLAHCKKPKLFVQGTRDQYGSQLNLERLFERIPEPKRLVYVNDADHFFAGRLEEFRRVMAAGLAPLLAAIR